jgi:hypothetical protein
LIEGKRLKRRLHKDQGSPLVEEEKLNKNATLRLLKLTSRMLKKKLRLIADLLIKLH